MALQLEDAFEDILEKAQFGLRIADSDLVQKTALSSQDIQNLKCNRGKDAHVRKVAEALQLDPSKLLTAYHKRWKPHKVSIPRLIQFTTPYRHFTVNAYLAWADATQKAVIFDTGTDCTALLETIEKQRLPIVAIFLTHGHPDHIAELKKLSKALQSPPIFAHPQEKIPGTEPIEEGHEFLVGSLLIQVFDTSGHSRGGLSYFLTGLPEYAIITGDALFAGSMGRVAPSAYKQALEKNRKIIGLFKDQTIICPGHGPMSTIGQEKEHNPFFPGLKIEKNKPSKKSKIKTKKIRISFVGLGNMGNNMARNLFSRNHREDYIEKLPSDPFTAKHKQEIKALLPEEPNPRFYYDFTGVCDKDDFTAEYIAKQLDSTAISHLPTLVSQSKVIFTVVENDASAENIYFNEKNNLLEKAKGKIFINCTTISPSLHEKIEKAIRQSGGHYVACCMLSTCTQARIGDIEMILGCEEKVFKAYEHIFFDLGKIIKRFSSPSEAAKKALLVSMLSNMNTAALAEAFALGKAFQFDLHELKGIFEKTNAYSNAIKTDAQDMIQENYDCYHAVHLVAKDMDIILKSSKAKELSLPLTQSTCEQYAKLKQQGFGALDKSSIAKLVFSNIKR